jgi:hypothetical protein
MTGVLQTVSQQYFLDDGTPNNGGTIKFNDAITNNLKDVFTDPDLTTPTANPLSLGTDGRPLVPYYLGYGTYDIYIYDSDTVKTEQKLNVPGAGVSSDESTQSVANIADLKALASGSSTYVDVAGYYTAGDGGGGRMYWDSTSGAAQNNGTIFIPNSFPGTGRWKRIYDKEIDIKWFGAYGDGANDDTTEIIAAYTWADANTNDIFFSDGNYLISGPLVFASATSVRTGAGAYFSAASAQNVTFNGPCLGPLTKRFGANITAILGDGNLINIYPEWWGVDGTADEVQIQAAIVSAYTMGGGRIVLGPKTYNAADAITLYPFVSLSGTSAHETTISHTGASNILQATPTGILSGSTLLSTVNVSITDLGLIGDDTDTLDGLWLEAAPAATQISNITTKNVRISKCKNNGLHIRAHHTCNFQDMNIFSNGGNGLNIDTDVTTTSCNYINIYCDSNTGAGFSASGSGGVLHDQTFINCYSQANGGNGWEILGPTAKYNINFIGCRSETDGGHSMELSEVVGTNIGWYPSDPGGDQLNLTAGKMLLQSGFFGGSTGGFDIDYGTCELSIINCRGLTRDVITGTVPIYHWDQNIREAVNVDQTESPFQIELWDNGATFTNLDATSAVVFNLPNLDNASKVGFRVGFIAREAEILDIVPGSGDRILPRTIASPNKLRCTAGKSATMLLKSVDQTIWSMDNLDIRWYDGNQNQLFVDGDTTPDIRGSSFYTTQNTGSTIISNLENGFKGQEIIIKINDDNTTFANGANLTGNYGFSWRSITGDEIRAVYNGSSWLLTANSDRSVQADVTASTTDAQGQGNLGRKVTEFSTVGATNAATAKSVSIGMEITVINNGANTLNLYPASGDDIGGGVDTKVSVLAGTVAKYIGKDDTTWIDVS